MAHIDIHYGFSVNGVASLHTEILKMGLKSNEIDHLPIRQLKQTANEPVTIPALLMTDGL